jgi:mutator protein MutT
MKANWKNRHSVVPAVYVILRRDNKVLLLKRANTGYRDGFYSLPAGHLDGGEPAKTAALRELKEEVGIKSTPEKLILIHTQHRLAEEGDHERLNLYFELKEWEGEPINSEPDKCSEIKWYDLGNLPNNLVPELQHMFQHYKTGENYGDFDFN